MIVRVGKFYNLKDVLGKVVRMHNGIVTFATPSCHLIKLSVMQFGRDACTLSKEDRTRVSGYMRKVISKGKIPFSGVAAKF